MGSPSYECCTALAIIGMISTEIRALKWMDRRARSGSGSRAAALAPGVPPLTTKVSFPAQKRRYQVLNFATRVRTHDEIAAAGQTDPREAN